MNRSERLQYEYEKRLQNGGAERVDSVSQGMLEAGDKRHSIGKRLAALVVIVCLAVGSVWSYLHFGRAVPVKSQARNAALQSMWDAQAGCEKLRRVNAENGRPYDNQWREVEAIYRQGVVAFERGKYPKSCECFERVGEIVSNIETNGVVPVSMTKLRQEALGSVLKAFAGASRRGTPNEDCVDIDKIPDDAEVHIQGVEVWNWYNQGMEDYKQWRFADAERCFRRAIELADQTNGVQRINLK